ncbi:hypothetical protein GWC95_12890 [Sediminibacterium roseum]|uniref:Lipoprotein n=1 Tax=Sediminibacterium roseum TaxID=1978412 RepID=A0ABX0A082_9BACT|nr:hypothetical protein [Sediminibacterium roseum]NCI50828.1 hypothetical protein [Sediminibacterium roseum]
MKSQLFNRLLLFCICICLLSSCAAAGNMIRSSSWLGLIDLAGAAGITLFILRGKK